MTHVFDLKWLLLIPVLPTVGFLAWSLLNFTRSRGGRRQRFADLIPRRRNRVEIWD